MTKFTFIIVLVLVFMISCSDNDDTIVAACGANNPTQELAWLKTEIDRRNENPNDDMKYCYIVLGQFKGDDIFIYADCNPLIDKAIPYYNCEGEILNAQENPIGFDQVKNKNIIWKRNDFVCQTSF